MENSGKQRARFGLNKWMNTKAFLQSFFLWAALFLMATPAFAEEHDSGIDLVERYRAARTQFEQAPKNVTNAWLFAKACFELADQSVDKSNLESIAQEGVDAGRAAVAADSNSAPAHYYLALNIGALAQTKMLGALKLVRQMEAELLRSISIEAGYDHAGAERSLGMLYRDTPGWPASIGSKSKARQQLESAVKLAADFPDNHLTLMESYLKWNEKNAARKAAGEFKKIKDDARKKYAGSEWASAWKDWDKRWRAILDKLNIEE